MLRAWFTMLQGSNGSSRCEAQIYACARSTLERSCDLLQSQLKSASVDLSDLDELKISTQHLDISSPVDMEMWNAVLHLETLQHACVNLRFSIDGKFASGNGKSSNGDTTFVLVGAPQNGGMLVKAVWQMGHDPGMESVYKRVAWHQEAKFVEAFDLYLANLDKHPGLAARYAMGLFGESIDRVFIPRRTQQLAMMLIRLRSELPDERGPALFARRVSAPLIAAALTGGLAFPVYGAMRSISIALALVILSLYLVYISLRIAFQKLILMTKYHRRMRAALGQLYSGPINYTQIDLSQDQTPALLKFSAEIEAMGGQHICDVAITTARGVLDGNRIYQLGDSTVSLGLLKKTENLLFFPAQPVIICSTRFEDGRRHSTVNRSRHRKPSVAHVTGRCLINGGGLDELLQLHNRHVSKLIASGATPVKPESTAAQTLARMQAEHEEAREGWQRSPYSWGDALHDAFKVCRKEYLAD